MGVAERTHRFRAYRKASIDKIPQLEAWAPRDRRRLRTLAYVFPFRVNSYQLDELIDWDRVPDDPIFLSCSRSRKCSIQKTSLYWNRQ